MVVEDSVSMAGTAATDAAGFTGAAVGLIADVAEVVRLADEAREIAGASVAVATGARLE